MASFWLNVGYMHGIFLNILCDLVNDLVHVLKSYWMNYMNAWDNMSLMQLVREGSKPSQWSSDETDESMNKNTLMTHKYFVYKVFV